MDENELTGRSSEASSKIIAGPHPPSLSHRFYLPDATNLTTTGARYHFGHRPRQPRRPSGTPPLRLRPRHQRRRWAPSPHTYAPLARCQSQSSAPKATQQATAPPAAARSVDAALLGLAHHRAVRRRWPTHRGLGRAGGLASAHPHTHVLSEARPWRPRARRGAVGRGGHGRSVAGQGRAWPAEARRKKSRLSETGAGKVVAGMVKGRTCSEQLGVGCTWLDVCCPLGQKLIQSGANFVRNSPREPPTAGCALRGSISSILRSSVRGKCLPGTGNMSPWQVAPLWSNQ
jgi:hypothetical protein